MSRRATALRVGLAGLVGVLAFVTAAPGASAIAPPVDPNAKGYIGLCDRTGKQVTSGNINDTPFVWKAVAANPVLPAMYRGRGQNAILSIYQLRPNYDSTNWSGEQMTAASYYTAAPTTVGTTQDDSLATFIRAYPPKLDGLYELRMFFAANQAPTYSATYPALYIRVTGSTWTALGTGKVNCPAAKAQSSEVIDGVVAPGDSGGVDLKTAVAPLPTGGLKAGPEDQPSSAAASQVADTHRTSSGMGIGAIVAIVLTVGFVAGGGGYWWYRRRWA